MIWHGSTSDEVLKNFNVDINNGLDSTSAAQRLEKYKENEIHGYKNLSLTNIFYKELTNKFNITLIIFALIYFIVSSITKFNGTVQAITILLLAIIRIIFKTFQDYLSNRHLNQYRISIKSTATVIRDSVEKIIPANQLVPGDIIIIKEGDYIPADARLIDSYVLKCDEFALTGEEVVVDKIHSSVYDDITPISKRFNMIYCGTYVVNGQATAVVTGTGAFTEISKAENIEQIANSSKTHFINNINSIENIITKISIFTSVLLFLITLLVNFNSSSTSFALLVIERLLLSLAFFSSTTTGFISAYYSFVVACSTKHFEKTNVIPVNIEITEKLKDISVICTDKSGVITSNKMSVSKVFNGTDTIDLKTDKIDESVVSILRLALICSNFEESEHYEKHTNSMEKAIEDACIKFSSVSKTDIDGIYPKLCELPFAHDRRLMSIVTVINGRPYAIVKGAPEVISSRCLNANENQLNSISNAFAEDALKVISVAMKPLCEIPVNPTSDELENDLSFIGTIGIEDPINQDIVTIIKNCKSNGKRIIMLTGDHISTAISVAKRVGILIKDEQAICCDSLSQMTDEDLCERINEFTVFARATSEDKLRIVKALNHNGEKVLVTGDSIKDSYVLREAEIGCSMGLTATDMVNYSADMVITDNKFSSIFAAICESYNTINNIKKGLSLILTCNIIELITIILGTLIFKTTTISASIILLINLLLNGLLISAFAAERHKDLLNETFIDKFVNLKFLISLFVPTVIVSIFCLVGFGMALSTSLGSGLSTVFATFSLSMVVHALSINVNNTLFSRNILNLWCVPIVSVVLIAMILLLILTPVGSIFAFLTIPKNCTILILLSCLCVLLSDEIIKFIIKYYVK